VSVDLNALLDPVVSHALALGVFDRVNAHEPESVPGSGLTMACWLDAGTPAPAGSGLAATSMRIALFVRLYKNLLTQPADMIDSLMMDATSALLAAYSGDFDMGGSVRAVDLLGMYGEPLSFRAGYLPQGDANFRVITIVVPLIVDDVWTQTP
jgi:hypothetical protein